MRRRWKILIAGTVGVVALGGYGLANLANHIYMRYPEVQLTPADLSRRHTPQALRNDLDAAIATMERVHPNLYAFTAQSVVAARVSTLKASLSAPLTRLEFFRQVASINSLFDGHTAIGWPDEEWDAFVKEGGRVFPADVRIAGHAMTVVKNLSANPDLIPGSSIVSINGVPVESILDDLYEATNGERLEEKGEDIGKSFARRYWTVFGGPERFELEVVLFQKSTAVYISVEGQPFKAVEAALASRSEVPNLFEFKLLADEKVAYLFIPDLEHRNAEFEAFLKSAFEKIQSAAPRALIIDFRKNGGGDSTQGDRLLRYLTSMHYEQTAQLDIRSSAEIKQFYHHVLPPGLQWISPGILHPIFRGMYDTADGAMFVYSFPEPTPQQEPEALLFQGPIYLLIGGQTYSAAAMFAQTFKHYKVGTVVGQESGEPTVFYGDNYIFFLPETQLRVSVSHKRFILPGGREDGRGTIPDHEVLQTPADDAAQRDAVLEYTLQLIDEK